jgi:hypothetical protein
MQLHHYLSMLCHAEGTLADAFRDTAAHHQAPCSSGRRGETCSISGWPSPDLA